MHGARAQADASDRPQTTGLTLHNAVGYDLFTRLLGMGPRGRNSRLVVELAQVKSGHAVLDVACGTGNLTLAAAAAAGPSGRAHGIDASPEMIAQARRKAGRLEKARHAGIRVAFDVGLAEELPFPDETFDLAISRLAFHHLPDDLKARAFAEMLRVLKPGGRVLIADFTPSRNPLVRHVHGAIFPPLMTEYDIRQLEPLLAGAGFVDVGSGPTRSSILGIVRGRKPAATASS